MGLPGVSYLADPGICKQQQQQIFGNNGEMSKPKLFVADFCIQDIK